MKGSKSMDEIFKQEDVVLKFKTDVFQDFTVPYGLYKLVQAKDSFTVFTYKRINREGFIEIQFLPKILNQQFIDKVAAEKYFKKRKMF